MGFRYRKSVKICQGVRVNFSKSGVSYSFGRKGATLNVGKRGMRTTVGMPGTGLSYSTTMGFNQNYRLNDKPYVYSGNSQQEDFSSRIDIQMDINGNVSYYYANGQRITDLSVIRKIRMLPQFNEEYNRLETQRQGIISEIMEEKHKANEEFLNLHWYAPKVSSMEDYKNQLKIIAPQKYNRRNFSRPKPSVEQIKTALVAEAQKEVEKKAFWKRASLQQKYVEERLQERVAYYQQRWESDRERFENNESEYEKQQNEKFRKEYEKRKEDLISRMQGEESFVDKIIEEWIEECTLPVEINIDYSFSRKDNLLCIDLDLPEIEDIPDSEFVRLASGNLKEKKKTQQKLRQEYATLVFGLSIFIAANLMNLSPAIHKVMLSGYTQRRDTKGTLFDDYIISIIFTREIFERSNFKEINPIEFCTQFENRCKTTPTMIFKSIEPYSN